jgi:hypothetical protein
MLSFSITIPNTANTGKNREEWNMPRQIEITLPSKQTDDLLKELEKIEGITSLSAQKGGSVKPKGDIVRLTVSNAALHVAMRVVERRSLHEDPNVSISTSTLLSSISATQGKATRQDRSETTWEEMEELIGRESNMTVNAIIVMAISGILAAVGIVTGTLHFVIGGMLIAPGFMPITRIALGGVSRSDVWQRGLIDTLKGYLALITGAALTILFFNALGAPGLSWEDTYLADHQLVNFWLEISPPGMLVSAIAAIVGSVLVASNRSVLTGGAMIALALIPTAALIGMFLVMGEFGLMGQAALRWAIEVAWVLVAGFVVFAWKRAEVQKRDMMA